MTENGATGPLLLSKLDEQEFYILRTLIGAYGMSRARKPPTNLEWVNKWDDLLDALDDAVRLLYTRDDGKLDLLERHRSKIKGISGDLLNNLYGCEVRYPEPLRILHSTPLYDLGRIRASMSAGPERDFLDTLMRSQWEAGVLNLLENELADVSWIILEGL
jgi:hypothetical protein